MPENEDSGFQVVDKRRVGKKASADEDAAAPPPEPKPDRAGDGGHGSAEPSADSQLGTQTVGPEPQEPEESEHDEDEGEGEALPTSVVDLAQMCVGMMNEVAWVKMGLVPDPMTGALGADLAQARLAIDCAADVVHRLEGHLDPKTHRDLQVVVQNLKMNFVRKTAG